MKSQRITTVITIHPEGDMKIWIKFHGNPSSWDIYATSVANNLNKTQKNILILFKQFLASSPLIIWYFSLLLLCLLLSVVTFGNCAWNTEDGYYQCVFFISGKREWPEDVFLIESLYETVSCLFVWSLKPNKLLYVNLPHFAWHQKLWAPSVIARDLNNSIYTL